MNCITCNRYFKQNAFNTTAECENCLDQAFLQMDSETQVDVELLRNPSGKTSPVFYDESNDPEMDCRDSI
jgi:DNA-directed RNA polymerase subunit RPC12/RpoP